MLPEHRHYNIRQCRKDRRLCLEVWVLVDFFKVHGNGNDFVVLDNREGRLSGADLRSAAVALCRRRASIGADGLMAVERTEGADFRMRIFNADGSEAEMCGNGARALARYAYERGIASSPMRFITESGLIEATVEPPFVELDMGRVDLAGGIFGRSLRAGGVEFPFVFLTVGVPHCVLLADEEYSENAMREIGRTVRYDAELFPEGANVTFARRLPSGDVAAVTYERGVEDLTDSCGTGCVAVAVAGVLVWSLCAPIRVVNPGGTNTVRLEFASDNASARAWLRGRTALVASGTLFEEAWS